ncbi:hypothetical protein K227x_54070 [Rubripirellula lacrimiformis]|uniref:Uncharacterized protein n=2 Tax=Rubripirellula lacrimiformis TaxID=1930273 RepID=A0A517NIV9_9BACT|nr:hypothetical protein K227x_54070 [Rubripirellula lacrimiformis]
MEAGGSVIHIAGRVRIGFDTTDGAGNAGENDVARPAKPVLDRMHATPMTDPLSNDTPNDTPTDGPDSTAHQSGAADSGADGAGRRDADPGRPVDSGAGESTSGNSPSGDSTSGNSPSGSDSDDQGHRGYDLETGLLARVRDWVDVFPWVRLGQTLRIAASPSMLSLTALAMAIHFLGMWFLFGSEPLVDADRLPPQILPPPILTSPLAELESYFVTLSPTSIYWNSDRLGGGWSGVAILWTLLVWVPPVLWLTRQGALLTAGRTMAGNAMMSRHVIARTPAAWLSALVPVLCIGLIGVGLIVIGAIARVVTGPAAVGWAMGLIATLVAIPGGLLLFGSLIAVPLAWAAIANEADSDPLDALSRGYEYFYRRPLHWISYGLVSLVMLVIVAAMASGVAWASELLCVAMIETVGGPPQTVEAVQFWCHKFPTVVSLTLFWAMVGGVYLLVRCNAGGQEVEDLWQPKPPAPPSMPELP